MKARGHLMRTLILILLFAINSLAEEAVVAATAFEAEMITTPSTTLAEPVITAKLEAATACHLKKYRSLSGFLSRESEFYDNLDFQRIPGNTVVLTIFHDGQEVETIDLKQQEWNDAGKLRQFLKDKGIRYKSDDELREIQDRRRQLADEHRDEQRRKAEEAKADRERRGIDLAARLRDKVAQRKREREQEEQKRQQREMLQDEEDPQEEDNNLRDEL